jgi:hypothetical protein
MLQALLNWLSKEWTPSKARSPMLDYSKGLLGFYGGSFLRLLAEWGALLARAAVAIHTTDPATIFHSRDYGILAHLEQTMSYEKHIVLHEVETFTEAIRAPPNRRLPEVSDHQAGVA